MTWRSKYVLLCREVYVFDISSTRKHILKDLVYNISNRVIIIAEDRAINSLLVYIYNRI